MCVYFFFYFILFFRTVRIIPKKWEDKYTSLEVFGYNRIDLKYSGIKYKTEEL
jgi:hypothetical protein